MKTVTQHIREHLESQIRPAEFNHKPDLETLKRLQWSDQFEQLMRNRMVLGALRYELIHDKKGNNKYDILGSIERRIQCYRKTGNKEFLVDSANLMLIEFEAPTHPNAHFESIDDGEHVELQQ